jgi:hypothetical protein
MRVEKAKIKAVRPARRSLGIDLDDVIGLRLAGYD